MGNFAIYLENKLLDEAFGAQAFSGSANLYVGLSTTTVTDDGLNITQPGGSNYQRVQVTNNVTNFPNASSGAKANGTAITFNQATGSWGTVTDFFISDAATAGNIYCYGALTTPKAVSSGDTLSFAIGDLDITLE